MTRRVAAGALGPVVILCLSCSLVGPVPSPPAPGEMPVPAPLPPVVDEPAPLPAPRIWPVPTPFREVRALWVVRTTLTDRDRIETMVAEAVGAGFNTLIVQVRGRGDAFYDSRFEPRAASLAGQPPSFDPLALVIREAHRQGLQVHAWVNTYLVAGSEGLPADGAHMVRAAPDLLAVPRELAGALYGRNPFQASYVEALLDHARRNRDRVEGLYASPAHPEVQNRVYRVWMDLAERYDLDGLHFDYVRYPNRDFDYSRGALDAFRAWAGPRVDPGRITALDAGARAKPTAWPDALPDLWDEFRRAQVTGLVRRVYLGVKTARPDFVVSAAVFADAEDASRHRFQDWMGWLEAGILDVAAPMAYTNDDGRFRAQIRDAVQAARDPRRVWAGIGAYANTSDGTVSKIGIARQEGAGGVVLFSYDWATAQGATRGVTFLERVGRASFRDGGGGG